MFYPTKIFVFLFVLILAGCNKNLTEQEKKELWSKAQTTGQIIERSGTVFNSATNKDLAMRDATTRLQTGGGLFGKKGVSVDTFGGKAKQEVQHGDLRHRTRWERRWKCLAHWPRAQQRHAHRQAQKAKEA